MPDSTRRGFLAMTGGGVAAAGAAAVVPTLLAGDRATSAMSSRQPAVQVEGPLIAYVNDVSSGEVVVMVGEREVSAIDHDLARKLAAMSRAEG